MESRLQAIVGRIPNSTIYHKGDGYFYILREQRGKRARLKCRHYRTCHGTAAINTETLNLYHLIEHNHEPDRVLPQDLQMRRRMVADAASSTSGRTPRQIINDWRLRCPDPELGSRFTSARMRSSLNLARRLNYPEIPRSLMSLGLLLGLPNMQALTLTKDRTDTILRGFTGLQGDKSVSVIFISMRFLQFLSTLSSIHLDGTFKKRPKKPSCSQIYNIVTNYGGAVICIARVLMMRRTEAAYLALFTYLKTLAPNFNPSHLYCDFERAQMNALRAVWPPPCQICGCLWHYGVACSSQARQLQLAALAEEHEEVFTFIRCLSAVPLLPNDMIMDGVNELWQEVSGTRWRDNFQPLFQYFRREWQPRVDELSVFRCHERTNNSSESDNHSLSVLLPKNRPSIWQCIGAFVDLEYLAWNDKLAADRGDPVNDARKWSVILNDRRVANLSTMLERREISPGRFLHRASWSILAAVWQGLRLRQNQDSDSEDDSDSGSDTDTSTESESN